MSSSSPSATYDVVVIGAGPGGYVCAFRAAQLGMKVALVDKRPTLGGTCLNVGCIPSKALLHSSEHVTWAQQHAAEHGIKLGKVEVDLPAFLKRKDEVVAKLVGGVAQLAKARRITVVTGAASFVSAHTVKVEPAVPGGLSQLTAQNIVIATGSAPVELPFLKFDGETIVSSDHAIAFNSVPKIVANYDDDIVRNFTRILSKQGLKIEVNARVTGFVGASLVDARSGAGERRPYGILTAERDGQKLEFEADKVLVSVGRRPFTDGLGLEKTGVQLDEKKRIKVDDHLRTTAPGIWAIGDVIAGPMLAHKAEEDGVAVAEWIAGKAGHVNWDLVPAIVYTSPEVAAVGLGEDGAKAKGLAVKVGKFNLAANGRAIAANATDGYVKIIADAKTDRILGCQILGHNAGELISEVVTHMEYGGSAEDLGRTIHAHPTMSEAVKEAGLAVSKSAIHAL